MFCLTAMVNNAILKIKGINPKASPGSIFPGQAPVNLTEL